jgi:hypothetical protein
MMSIGGDLELYFGVKNCGIVGIAQAFARGEGNAREKTCNRAIRYLT